MQQKFNPNTSIMPPIIPQIASIPSISHLPPPPPGPAPLPPPPPDSGADAQPTSNLNDPLNQRSFQASVTSVTINRNTNFLTQPVNSQQFNRGTGGGISQNQNQNQYSGLIGRNQFESVANNVPKANEPVAKPLNQVTEDVSDKSPEEKAFDEQFKKWEEEFANWKLQNANHPDRRAYMEYEQKMEECRTKLLERREQMKRRKLELLQQQQKQQQSQQHVPAIPQESLRILNEQKTSGFNQTTGTFENNELKEDQIGGRDVLENSANDKSELFMRSSLTTSGIPGLDLVVDKVNDKDDDEEDDVSETVIINDTSPKREEKIPYQISNNQQRPDLEAISRGLTSILGDPNLASLLSNFQAPKSISNTLAKPAIPSLLDMKMPDIDLDKVPRFNWKDDDDDGDDSIHSNQRHQTTNDLSSNNVQSGENTQQNSNQLNNCDDDDYEENMEQHERFNENMEHERFNERNYDDSNNSFPMNRGDVNNFSNQILNSRDNFNRNMTQNRGNNFDSLNQNFMKDNEPNDNFNQNRSNFMNDNGPKDNFNRMNFMNDRPNENFNQNRSNFNDNLRGNNSFVGGNSGNFNQQNSFNFQGNRMNPFDKPVFGNNSNFNNDRNQLNNNFQQNANFSGNNNFGNNFNRSMMNDQFNNDNNEFINGMRNDDRNSNDFSRRRNFDNNDRNFNDFDGSNSQFPLSFRNNNRSDDNSHSQNTPQLTSTHNRGLPTDSFISDNAKDEDFFRPTKIIDYSAKPTQIATKDEILMPMKVIDYGHQTNGIVSRPQNISRPRPANKCTGDDFFPVKTIDYNHSNSKHMIKEYYYSIVSKWDPNSSNNSKSNQSQQGPGRSNPEGLGNNQPIKQQRLQTPQIHKTKELKEITYEQLSAIDTSTRHGKKMKRALIMKVSS